MTQYIDALPQSGREMFLTDSGLETELIYNQGVDLQQFAAFPNCSTTRRACGSCVATRRPRGHRRAGRCGVRPRVRHLAGERGLGALLGYDAEALGRVNRKAVDLLVEVRADWAKTNRPYPISGCLGPRDDGYAPGMLMTAEAARAYHRQQIATFADTPAD